MLLHIWSVESQEQKLEGFEGYPQKALLSSHVLTKWKHLWNRFFFVCKFMRFKKLYPDHEKEWEFSDLCSLKQHFKIVRVHLPQTFSRAVFPSGFPGDLSIFGMQQNIYKWWIS